GGRYARRARHGDGVLTMRDLGTYVESTALGLSRAQRRALAARLREAARRRRSPLGFLGAMAQQLKDRKRAAGRWPEVPPRPAREVRAEIELRRRVRELRDVVDVRESRARGPVDSVAWRRAIRAEHDRLIRHGESVAMVGMRNLLREVERRGPHAVL